MPLILSLLLHLTIFLGEFSLFRLDIERSEPTTMQENNVARVASFNLKKAALPTISNSIPEKKIEKSPNEKIVKEIKKEVVKKEIKKKIVEKKENIEEVEKYSPEKTISQENLSSEISESSIENIQQEVSDYDSKLFTSLADGTYAVKNQGVSGISYEFISSPNPKYPFAAKKIGYIKTVEVKVKFLIGLDGRVEDIFFYGDDPGVGFRDEVRKTLKEWRATPVTLKGKPVKLFFYKGFTFKTS